LPVTSRAGAPHRLLESRRVAERFSGFRFAEGGGVVEQTALD
jgi:hypothetical protein